MEFDNDKAKVAENPDYVLFNGKKVHLLGANMIEQKLEKLLDFYWKWWPKPLTSSFHVIGEIFDNVYLEGGSTVSHNIQTTMIPAYGSAIVEFKMWRSGWICLVDHLFQEHLTKGCIGKLKVTGEPNEKSIQCKNFDKKNNLLSAKIQRETLNLFFIYNLFFHLF